MSRSLDDLFSQCQLRLDNLFHIYIANPHSPAHELQQAMLYATQNGGKRIRPLLVYITGQILDVPLENVDAAACAIELIHTYSLIHDDLPAMDDSDLRRGKPACHKAFSEATAILAGDALQPLAFEIITLHPSNLTPQQRLEMINVLSKASGIEGMVAGQALDLAGVNSIESLNQMYHLKTGALLRASVELGIAASHTNNPKIIKALLQYIENVSLAFQIQDDLLDLRGDPNITGKPQGLDHSNRKITYPGMLGMENTQNTVQHLFDSALQAIYPLGDKASILQELAHFLLKRDR